MYGFRQQARLLSLSVVIALLLSIVVAPAAQAGGKNNSSFDMNDRFATEKGASGHAISKVDDGELGLHLVAKGLQTNHDYEVLVTIGIGDAFGGVDLLVFPVTSDKNGKLKFDIKGLDLGLAPGDYRLDFLVVHPHGDPDPTLRDLLLACQPAPRVTVD